MKTCQDKAYRKQIFGARGSNQMHGIYPDGSSLSLRVFILVAIINIAHILYTNMR
jgi:hypothetical protein